MTGTVARKHRKDVAIRHASRRRTQSCLPGHVHSILSPSAAASVSLSRPWPLRPPHAPARIVLPGLGSRLPIHLALLVFELDSACSAHAHCLVSATRPPKKAVQITIYPLYLVPLAFYSLGLLLRESVYSYALMFRGPFQLRHIRHHLVMYPAGALRLRWESAPASSSNTANAPADSP